MTDRDAGGLAAGARLNWLNGIATDVPVGVSSETGGAGDDIHLEFIGWR